jgi:hypothetical protein
MAATECLGTGRKYAEGPGYEARCPVCGLPTMAMGPLGFTPRREKGHGAYKGIVPTHEAAGA